MMNKVYKRMRTAVVCGLLCAFLSGCGDEKPLVIISQETETVIETEAEQEPSETGSASGICVYVCGAVTEPGVVELAEGSRVQQALEAAGGFAENARTDYVNLAARVTDGEKLYFPTREEAEELERAAKAGEDRAVNINTADEQELCSLPGIGAAKAGDIISYREKNGEFQAPEDLMKVPGIKENAYEKLKDKIVTE